MSENKQKETVPIVIKPFPEVREKALKDLANCITDPELVEKLKESSTEDKAEQPVILNQNGIIINGANRLYADNNWDIVVRQMSDTEAFLQRYKEEIQTKSPELHRQSLSKTIERLQTAYREPSYRTELQRWCEAYSKSLGTSTTEKTFKVDNFTILGFGSLSQAINTKISKELGISRRYERKHTPKQFKEIKKTHKDKGMRNTCSSSTESEQKPSESEQQPTNDTPWLTEGQRIQYLDLIQKGKDYFINVKGFIESLDISIQNKTSRKIGKEVATFLKGSL